jgi:hypothetical protein
LLYRLLRLDPTNQDDRNALFLIVEVFWAAILSAAAGFNAAYALRLNATNTDIGLLSSLPALLAVLVSIPAGHFLQSRTRRKPWILWSLFLNRAGYLVIALLPFIKYLGFTGINQGSLVVIVLIIFSTPAHFFNVGWIAMLGEIIPEDRRAAVFTARNITVNATVSVVVFLFGLWLNWIVFPLNYQAMFAVGFVASLLSSYALIRLEVPESTATPLAANSLKDLLRAFQEAFRTQPNFMRLTTNTIMHGVGLWLASPLYILYYVRTLHASDAWLGVQGMVASVATIVGFSLSRWALTKIGEPKLLKCAIITAGLIPILVGLLPHLNLIILVIALNGLIASAIGLSHFNILLKTMPPNERPVYTAMYTTLVNIGACICPFIGVEIANQFGVSNSLIVFGMLSILGSSSFWWRPVKAE